MAKMRVPSTFRALSKEALNNTKAVTADKTMLMAGNTGWLYEGFLDRTVPGNDLLSNKVSFDHTGKGRGRPLPVIMNLMRGLYRSSTNFYDSITLVGSGTTITVYSLINDFNTQGSVSGGTGYNWRKTATMPFIPHIYAKKLRTRLQVQRSAGSGTSYIYPCIYYDKEAVSLLGRGSSVTIDQSSFTTVELVIDLDDLSWERGTLPGQPWYWGLKVWIPYNTTVKVQDGSDTGPCLAVSSV